MVMDLVEMIMENPAFMLVSGLVLAIAGYQGVVSPDAWALAMQPFGQLFNVLPNVVHQILGGLIAVGGLGQVVSAVQEY
jgi:hypothetical protein